MRRFHFEKFRELCESRHPRVTQSKIKEITGKSISAISGWGLPPRYSQPDAETVAAIANHFQVDPEILYTEEPFPEAKTLTRQSDNMDSFVTDLLSAVGKLGPFKYRLLAEIMSGNEPVFLNGRDARLLKMVQSLPENERRHIEECLERGGRLKCSEGNKAPGGAARGSAPPPVSPLTPLTRK